MGRGGEKHLRNPGTGKLELENNDYLSGLAKIRHRHLQNIGNEAFY